MRDITYNLIAGLLLMLAAGAGVAATHNTPAAREIPIDGPIGPAISGYVVEQIQAADKARVPVIILRIDTPGGLVGAMRDIVKAILASPVPVVGYVGPSGARAASAGTYILYATHIAAMAPATNLGAATPIRIGASDDPGSEDSGSKNSGGKGSGGKDSGGKDKGHGNQGTSDRDAAKRSPPDGGSTEHRKMVNDAVAYIRSLAEQRHRNADWAEQAVRQAASLTAQQALNKNVINLIAPSESALLSRIDGQTITTQRGPFTLHTAGLAIDVQQPGWRTQLLALVTDPTVAYLLFMAGIVGLVIEGFNPGGTLPGVIGAICLITSLFAFQVLPVNYAGLALIVLGVVLFIAEALVPSFGVLGFGGVAAFVFGSVMLMDTNVPGFDVSMAVIIGIAVVAAAAVALVVYMFLRSRSSAIHTGAQGMIGSNCQALADFQPRDTGADSGYGGRVLLRGESWLAVSAAAASEGQFLQVSAVDGLTLRVRPVDRESRGTQLKKDT